MLIDNTPPSFEGIEFNTERQNDIIYMNNNASIKLFLEDSSDITSVEMKVIKVLGDPAIYEYNDTSMEWSSVVMRRSVGDHYYITPTRLTYSFFDTFLMQCISVKL